MKNYVAVIQAGGKGTRLRKLTKDEIPKPLLLLNQKPMIQWQMEQIKNYGIREFILIIGHLGEKIEEYFQDGSRFGVHIRYIKETEPLGSAGAFYYLKEMIPGGDFLLVFGDVMFDIDWGRMIRFHEEKHGLATLFVHPNSHPYDSDVVMMDKQQCVVGMKYKKDAGEGWYDNCVNAGLYILTYDILDEINFPKPLDLEKELLKPYLEKGRVFAYRSPEYVKDAGTQERFYQVCKEQQKGLWERKNLRQKQKCVFLDRDGTVNRLCGLLYKEEQLELEEGAAEAIALLNASEYLVIVVTNQPVVARGLCSVEDVENIHKKMQVLLGEKGAYADDIIFCPHHPDKGFPEENPRYKIPCKCRKPQTGMIEKMAEKYHIDLAGSYMVGDSTVDIQTGLNAGVKTILLETGMAGMDGKYEVTPDYKAVNLFAAAQVICGCMER